MVTAFVNNAILIENLDLCIHLSATLFGCDHKFGLVNWSLYWQLDFDTEPQPMGNVGSAEEGVEETPGQGSSTAMPTSDVSSLHQEILTATATEMQPGRAVLRVYAYNISSLRQTPESSSIWLWLSRRLASTAQKLRMTGNCTNRKRNCCVPRRRQASDSRKLVWFLRISLHLNSLCSSSAVELLKLFCLMMIVS